MKIDFVLTYVDQNDKFWYKEMKNCAKLHNKLSLSNPARFRDWETLKYIFRGIEKYMQWINNVYLVVACESQVPEWINTNKVKVIYHEQIIPYKYLPTFNSNTIELFLHNIPGLQEYFLYSNDDIFIINRTSEKSWFSSTGLPKINVYYKLCIPTTIYHKTLKNTENLCRKDLNMVFLKNKILRSDHSINPMRKSTWEYMWKNYYDDLDNSITAFRSQENITQELSNYYHFLNQKFEFHTRNNKYFDFKKNRIIELNEILFNSSIQHICINDLGVKDFNTAKEKIHNIFEKKFPNKSKYEN